jgi:hypothetical protein
MLEAAGERPDPTFSRTSWGNDQFRVVIPPIADANMDRHPRMTRPQRRTCDRSRTWGRAVGQHSPPMMGHTPKPIHMQGDEGIACHEGAVHSRGVTRQKVCNWGVWGVGRWDYPGTAGFPWEFPNGRPGGGGR